MSPLGSLSRISIPFRFAQNQTLTQDKKGRCNICANCHIVTCEIEMKSLDAIKAACKRMGLTFKEGQKTYKWYGNWMDDSPVPRYLFENEEEWKKVEAMSREDRTKIMEALLGKCDHAIRLPGCDYEVGIMQRGETYTPVWDWWRSQMITTLGQNGEKLSQAYAVEASILEAQAHAYTYTEETQEDGSIQLTVQVPDF